MKVLTIQIDVSDCDEEQIEDLIHLVEDEIVDLVPILRTHVSDIDHNEGDDNATH